MSVRRLAAALSLLAPFACGPSRPRDAVSDIGVSRSPERAVPLYAFESLDARPVSSQAFAGKVVVLAFVATWDLPSQAQVAFLVEMARRDGPSERVAYAAVFLQEGKDRELIEVYRTTLGIKFPVAVADRGTLSGAGPFGDVQAVPTVVVLDKSGHVRFQKVGLAKPDELRGAMSLD